MAVKLNTTGYKHALKLISQGKIDAESDWSFTADDGNKLLEKGGWKEYKKWFLGYDPDVENEETKQHWKYPFGKNGKIYRRGVIAAKTRAAQQGHGDIVKAADKLLQKIDEKLGKKEEKSLPVVKDMQYRNFQIAEVREIENREDVLELSFSSEQEVKRFFGIEVLSHEENAIDWSYLKNSAPLLLEHDPNRLIGVVEDAWLSEGKGRARVRFSKNSLAREVLQDVRDGIRKNVSVGYQIHSAKLLEERDGVPVYLIDRWTPLEISFVAVPADITVGVGRKKSDDVDVSVIEQKTKEEERKMEDKDLKNKSEDIRKEIKEIYRLGREFNMLEDAEKFIDEGKSLEEFRAYVLEKIKAEPIELPLKVDMNEREIKEYSLLRAIQQAVRNNGKLVDGFEREIHEELEKKFGKPARGFYVPVQVLTRDVTTTTAAGAVETKLLTSDFIDMLKNKLVLSKAGVRVLRNLIGNVDIPKKTATGSVYWVTEGNAPTEANLTIGKITLSPKTIAGTMDYTRNLLNQTSMDVEQLIKDDLVSNIAIGVETAAINGSGSSGEPTGLLNTSGVNVVSIGTNGGNPTWSHIVQLETEVAVDNADIGTLAYVTNAKVRGYLKVTPKVSGYPLFIWGEDNRLNGYNALVTNCVPSNLTKGTGSNLSAILFGKWDELLIAHWGVLDIVVDPYTNSKSGIITVTLFQDVDVGVRYPAAFAVIKDAATS